MEKFAYRFYRRNEVIRDNVVQMSVLTCRLTNDIWSFAIEWLVDSQQVYGNEGSERVKC